MNDIIKKHENEFVKTVQFFQEELKSLKTGRATPAIIENIPVEAYGVKTPLKQLASIGVSDAKTLIIQPWDKNILKDIEKAVVQSNMGINPINDGQFIRLIMPQLTEENRKKLVVLIHEKAEKCKTTLRSLRDRVKDEIMEAEKNKEITEDDRYRYIKELNDFTGENNDQIKFLSEEKEQELMTI